MTENTQSTCALSVVVPCYNEAKSLPKILRRFAEAGHGRDFELILVDNGSSDETPAVLADLLPGAPFARSVRVEVNQGYGHGIFTGLQSARGKYLAWTHADLQTDPADVFHGYDLLAAVPDPQKTLVKGRRLGRAASEKFVTLGMQIYASAMLGTGLSEINAQPKIFARELLALVTSPPVDFNFDVYVYYRAKRHGWCILTFPVQFPPREYGNSHWSSTLRSRLRTIGKSVRYIAGLRGSEGRS